MEKQLEYVKSELERRKGQLHLVAADTGISRKTIGNITSGRFNPRLDTLQSLYAYLKKNAKRKYLDA